MSEMHLVIILFVVVSLAMILTTSWKEKRASLDEERFRRMAEFEDMAREMAEIKDRAVEMKARFGNRRLTLSEVKELEELDEDRRSLMARLRRFEDKSPGR